MAVDISDLPVPSKGKDIGDLPVPKEPSTALGATKAFGKELAEQIVPGGVAAAGATTGAELGLLAGPFAPVASPVLAVLGGLGGYYTGKRALKEQRERYGEDPLVKAAGFGEEQRRAERAQYPTATLAGEIAPAVPAGVGLARGGARLLKKGGEMLRTKTGEEAERLSEVLRTRMSGKAEELVKKQAAEAQAARDRLARAEQAQKEFEVGERTTAQRAAVREKEVTAGLDQIAPRTTRPTLAEDVGSVIQNQGRSNVGKLRQVRTEKAITKIKDPAFESAAERESSGDFISTNPKSANQFNSVISEIESQIKNTPEPYASELRRRLASVRGTTRSLTEAEQRVENLRASIEKRPAQTTKQLPMTLEQAEYLRRMLNSKDFAEGFPGLDVARMRNLGDRIREAMEAYEPRLGSYLTKYRELSAPITRALAGRGAALTEIELQEAENALFAADKSQATSYYLNGTRERAQRLLDLVGGKNPELMGSLRRYVRSQMEGMNANQASEFARKNEGLLQVFPELRAPVTRVVEGKAAAEQAASAVSAARGAAATRLQREASAAGRGIEAPERLAAEYSTDVGKITEATPDKVARLSMSLIDKMRNRGLVNDATHREVLREINAIDAQYGKTAEAKKAYELLWRKMFVYGGLGLGVPGLAVYYGHKALGE